MRILIIHHNLTKSAGTIRNWLHLCNFKVTETKKGCYFDGHEREDVVEVGFFKIKIQNPTYTVRMRVEYLKFLAAMQQHKK